MTGDSSTQSWDSIADDWIAHADTNDYRNFFLMPRMFEMLGDVRNLRVLDLGCGEGGYGRELARRGAQVVGLDGSARMIQIARHRAAAEKLDIKFICTNANAMDEIADHSFDLVVAPMSLMDVEDYPGAVRETHRVLAPGGSLVMSILHPCFSAPVSQWERDPNERHRLVHFKVDHYFERKVWEERITVRFQKSVLRRHRPLEDYMQVPLRTGFVLEDFCEPLPTEDELTKSARFRKITRVPYFLFMRWKRKT
ncbi:MAG: class I SAM-dependent methyltransferase [Blastocatellia bacterium]|nr:MAG: class I SAM-dependent methyltransferase [Blastocatellia bacterium]